MFLCVHYCSRALDVCILLGVSIGVEEVDSALAARTGMDVLGAD